MSIDEGVPEFVFRKEEACEFEEIIEGNSDEDGNPAHSSPMLVEAETWLLVELRFDGPFQ